MGTACKELNPPAKRPELPQVPGGFLVLFQGILLTACEYFPLPPLPSWQLLASLGPGLPVHVSTAPLSAKVEGRTGEGSMTTQLQPGLQTALPPPQCTRRPMNPAHQLLSQLLLVSCPYPQDRRANPCRLRVPNGAL